MLSLRRLVCYVGEKSYLSCALDSCVELSLMLCASSGNSSGKDLSTLADELSELCGILVVDKVNFINAENADFLSSAHHGLCGTRSVFCSVIHYIIPPVIFDVCDDPTQKGRSSSVLSSSNLGADALSDENEGAL